MISEQNLSGCDLERGAQRAPFPTCEALNLEWPFRCFLLLSGKTRLD